MSLKDTIYKTFDRLNLSIDGFPNEGVAAFGYWLRPRHGGVRGIRGMTALNACLELDVKTVMDVGSGTGAQARVFSASGRTVTCVDYGSSIYAQEADHPDGHRLLLGDFNRLVLDEKFDLVWSSHCLEHQRNVGQFLEKAVEFCAPGGWICITVPVCHRAMWGGHLTLWTPGLLAYNLALASVDISDAQLIHGWREFSILVQPRPRALPEDLTYDKDDIEKLADRLPAWCREGADSW